MKRRSTRSLVLYRFFKTIDVGGKVEEFVVEELPIKKRYARVGGKVLLGDETQFLMEKKGLTTLAALKRLSGVVGIPESKFGYAGLKDKHALTRQWVSAKLSERQVEKLKKARIAGIKLSDFRKGQRIKIGDLKGNRFRIIVKGAKKTRLPTRLVFPNYYGPQRFGWDNVEKGRELLKRKKSMDKRVLKLVSHAYQSYIFNRVLSECVKRRLRPETIPIVGFNTRLGSDDVSKIVRNVLKEEKVSVRDFKNPGTERHAVVETGLKHEQKNGKLFLQFSLPSGSYATVLLLKLKIKK